MAALVLALTLFSRPAQAIEIKEALWGFDGQIVMQRFNVFSVLVDNPAANVFDGTIELRKVVAGKQVDAAIVEPIYLAPYSSRWVQFYPYIKSDWDNWEVSWGKRAVDKYKPLSVRSGKPAAILLDDPDALAQSAGAIKRLPDNLFPAFVTATDCLAAVVVDHAPRWDPARQKAFMEWLRRGGRLYLLNTPEGKYPEFAGEMQAMNATTSKHRVGSGFVYRVERTRRMLDPPFVEKVIEAGMEPGSESAADVAASEPPQPADPPGGTSGTLADYGFANFKWDTELMLLTNLKKMSSPLHNWPVIHLLALIYLGLVYPGCLMLGRRHGGDYRVTFGFLIGTVVVFSLAFLYVGRRGYNEATVIHSLAIARQQEGGTLDVTQWSNAFAVQGGDYLFSHEGSGRIYSTCQDQEIVRGEIRNGPEAHLLADVPPYSSRAFSHRGVVSAPPIEVAVESWETIQDQHPPEITPRMAARKTIVFRFDRALSKLSLRKVRNFPAEHLHLHVLFGRKLYRLKETADLLELGAELGPLTSLLKTDEFNEYASLNGGQSLNGRRLQQRYDPAWHEPTQTDVFEALFFPLLARSLDLADQLEVDRFVLPPDRARLLIYAPLPPALRTKDARFGEQTGYVLYSIDLFEPEPR